MFYSGVFAFIFLAQLQVQAQSITPPPQVRVMTESAESLILKADKIRHLNFESLGPFSELESPLKLTATDSKFIWPMQLLVENGTINNKAVTNFVIINKYKNELQVISRLPLERYLLGVLAKEVPARWPLEALKSQAIAARSYALSKINPNSELGEYDLRSDILDQVFEFQKAHLESEHYQAIRAAVRETEGVVLKTSTGAVASTYFHADCGGFTVNAESVWGTKAQKVIAKDHLCATNAQKWEFITESEKKLSRVGKLTLQRHSKVNHLSANEIRRAFGFEKLKSSFFSLSRKGDTLIFQGQGRGHGVGLCQTGAKRWAETGWTYRKILNHYFPEYSFNQTKK